VSVDSTLQPAAAKRDARGKTFNPFALDFSQPAGEPALVGPNSVSWRVFKNPVALFIGGVTAVLLEFAEPKIRSGVWDHTTFRTDPVARMKRTGFVAMLSVYGPRSKAEAVIGGVVRMHERVRGTTPSGEPYYANDPVLLDWVQSTAGFGFLEAYSRFVSPVSGADKDRFYVEGAASAALFGAMGAPMSRAEFDAQLAAMLPRFEPSAIVIEFLEIMMKVPVAPAPLRAFQRLLVRAGVALLPPEVRAVLQLDSRWDLRPWQERLIRLAGGAADRVWLPSTPPVQACRRLGLPANYLYRP
jgi:uncharacterized protein (DUF2236 family)